MVLGVLHHGDARQGRVDSLAHTLGAGLAAIGVAVDAAAGGQDHIRTHVPEDLLHRQLGGAAGAGVHHGLDVPPGLGEELEAAVEHLIGDGELAVGVAVDLEVASGQTGELADEQGGGNAGIGGGRHGPGEVHVGQDGHVDVGVVRQHLQGVEAGGVGVDHQAVGAVLQGAVGVVPDLPGAVGDVDGIEAAFAGLGEDLLLLLHELGDPVLQGAEGAVGQHQLVVLDDVHAALAGAVEELRALVGGPADVGLDHGVEQGPVGDAQDLPQALHAELGALELGDELLGEGHVYEADHPRGGDVAEEDGQQGGHAGGEVGHGVGHLDDIQGRLVGLVVAARVGHLVEGHQLGAEAAGLLHRVGPHLDPGAGGLLVGDGHGQLFDVLGLDLGLVGGDHVIFVKGDLGKGVGQVFFIQSADHMCVLLFSVPRWKIRLRMRSGSGRWSRRCRPCWYRCGNRPG